VEPGHHTSSLFMRKRVLLPSAAVSVVTCLVAYLAITNFDVYAQQRARIIGPSVKQTAKSSAIADNDSRTAAFAKAAIENAKLRGSLQWVFGGKTQTGWDIYVPLISHTIGTDEGPETSEFAYALSRWQTQYGLTATGVLDRPTLESFTRYWQSRRLGRAGLSAGATLFAVPIGEFYDPTRSPDLLNLEQQTYTAYKKMVAAAAKDLKSELKVLPNGELAPHEKFLRIVSAYRSPEYQAQLRKREPSAGRAALAVNSPHSTGHALDIYVGGEPVRTLDSNRRIQVQTPAYKWLVKNAHKFGFYPYFYEPWHWEYVPGK
jgi:zinc D-Ala-D-Ala carboxypeptidase